MKLLKTSLKLIVNFLLLYGCIFPLRIFYQMLKSYPNFTVIEDLLFLLGYVIVQFLAIVVFAVGTFELWIRR